MYAHRHLHAQGRGGGGQARRVRPVRSPRSARLCDEPGRRGRRAPPAARSTACRCAYLWLDATYVKCRRRRARAVAQAVVTAIAARRHGGVRRFARRRTAVDTESYAGWLGFLLATCAPAASPPAIRVQLDRVGRPRGAAPGDRGVRSRGRRGSAASCIWSATRARCSGRSATAGRLAGSCRRCSRNPSRPRCERPTTRRSTRSAASPTRRPNCSRRPRPTRWPTSTFPPITAAAYARTTCRSGRTAR